MNICMSFIHSTRDPHRGISSFTFGFSDFFLSSTAPDFSKENTRIILCKCFYPKILPSNSLLEPRSQGQNTFFYKRV